MAIRWQDRRHHVGASTARAANDDRPLIGDYSIDTLELLLDYYDMHDHGGTRNRLMAEIARRRI